VAWLVAAACVVWHVAGAVEGWRRVPADWAGDFASFHYAATVSGAGGNPYDPEALEAAGRADGYRHPIFPFVYPPLALPLMSWSTALGIGTAFRLWFALNYVLAGWIGYVLWHRWGPRDPFGVPLVVASLAALYPVLNGLFQGQTNLLVLALTLTALWQVERRPITGGALLALATMVKVAPALFVLAWVAERRWRAIAAAVVAAPLLALVALPWAGAGAQLDYYTRILPAFSAGTWSVIDVPIRIFGNWSVLAWASGAFGSDGTAPAAAARAVAAAVPLVAFAAVAWSCRRAAGGRIGELARIGAIGTASLLLPAYTFEHHLVWALPGLVALGSAVLAEGVRHRAGHALALAGVWLALAVPLADLRLVHAAVEGWGPLEAFVRHLKLWGVVALFVATVGISGRAGSRLGSVREPDC
jgi:hypothetical protein